MMAIKTVVLVEGLHLPCWIGVPGEERKSVQNIEVDLRLTLADPAVGADRMESSVNYRTVVEDIQRLAETRTPRRLLETLASDIAMLCFVDARIGEVWVRLRKLKKLPTCESVGVERTFSRGAP